MNHAAEAAIGSIGITLFGFLSIPLVATLVGATVTMEQGAKMGLIFSGLRFLWLYGLRKIFARWWP